MKKVIYSEYSLPWQRLSEEEIKISKRTFQSYIDEEIQNTTIKNKEVKGIAFIGPMDRWMEQGEVNGMILNRNNELNIIGFLDDGNKNGDLEIGYDAKGVLEVRQWHEDGCHRMRIYLLTEDDLESYSPDFLKNDEFTVDDLDYIQTDFEPLNIKESKVFERYYGQVNIGKVNKNKMNLEQER